MQYPEEKVHYPERYRGLHRLMLRDDGFVYDDGVVARIGESTFHVTTTTGGAPRVLANVALRTIADRKQRMRELILRQREQEIGLILGGIEAALQSVRSGGAHARVVLDAGGPPAADLPHFSRG